MVEILRTPRSEVRIATERLLIRSVGPSDVEAIARHLRDLDVSRWLARVPHPYGLAEARALVGHVQVADTAGTAVTLAIVPREGETAGEAVGIVAIHGLDRLPEFGYWIGKAYWGRGLMTEATEAAMRWIYGNLAVDEIASGAFVGNDASLRIQDRLGFRVTGRSRRECQALGCELDHIDTRLTRMAFDSRA